MSVIQFLLYMNALKLCTFVTKLVPKQLEHEDVNISSLIFEHDWSNNMYCHKILYCIVWIRIYNFFFSVILF